MKGELLVETLDLSNGRENGQTDQYIEEYKMLRGEIIHYMEKDDAMCRQMYMVVASILSLTFTIGSRNVCLAAFCMIIPVSYKLVYSKERTAKLSTYMCCFLEEQIPGFCWESRVSGLRHGEKKHGQYRIRFHNMECISMALLCSAVYLYMFLGEMCENNNVLNIYWNAKTIMQVIFPITLSLWVFIITLKRDGFSDFQTDWESKWKNLKKEETENEKHKRYELEGVQQGTINGGTEKG